MSSSGHANGDSDDNDKRLNGMVLVQSSESFHVFWSMSLKRSFRFGVNYVKENDPETATPTTTSACNCGHTHFIYFKSLAWI